MSSSQAPKVLVTGHQGFIGIWTAFAFKQQGWAVYGLDNRSSYGERLYDKAELGTIMTDERDCDVADMAVWKDWIADIKPELIVNLAGQAIYPRAFADPYMTYRSNTLGTLAVLEVAKQVPEVKAALCVTSDKVYENNNDGHHFTEADKLGGMDIYSVSKSSAELVCKAYSKAHLVDRDLSVQSIRLGNVVGGGDWSINRLLPDLINAQMHGKEFKVRYMHATRPFQHVVDVARGIMDIGQGALDRSIESGEAWNLGPRNNSFASVREVIDLFQETYPDLVVHEETHRVKEDVRLQVDVTKYATQFAAPRDTSIESLRRTLAWYKAYYDGGDAVELMKTDFKGLGV